MTHCLIEQTMCCLLTILFLSLKLSLMIKKKKLKSNILDLKNLLKTELFFFCITENENYPLNSSLEAKFIDIKIKVIDG